MEKSNVYGKYIIFREISENIDIYKVLIYMCGDLMQCITVEHYVHYIEDELGLFTWLR